MNEFYYELSVVPSGYKDIFEEFLNDALPIGYEETKNGFIIRSEEKLDTIAWGLEQLAEAISKSTNCVVEVDLKHKKLQNSDWIEQYQKSIKPLIVKDFYIHPSWEEQKEDFINIKIDPSLAFGTGHHPTTFSCLEAVAKYVKKQDEVIDVGCGSGILSIAAMKKGAVVDGCDTDEVSVKNSLENAKLNNVSFRNIWQGSINKSDKKYDVIIANIVADVLIFLEKDFSKSLKNIESVLILSGILDKYETKVTACYKDYEIIEKISKDEWVTLVLKQKG